MYVLSIFALTKSSRSNLNVESIPSSTPNRKFNPGVSSFHQHHQSCREAQCYDRFVALRRLSLPARFASPSCLGQSKFPHNLLIVAWEWISKMSRRSAPISSNNSTLGNLAWLDHAPLNRLPRCFSCRRCMFSSALQAYSFCWLGRAANGLWSVGGRSPRVNFIN